MRQIKKITAALALPAALLLLAALFSAFPAFGQALRFDNQVLSPTGQAIAGASIAVCTQPAVITTPPCSPLATLYADSSGVIYGIMSAVRSNGVTTITTGIVNSIPVNVWVTLAGVTDPRFNGTFQVTSHPTSTTFTFNQVGANSSSSGGTVSGANPTFSDGLGNYFFYAARQPHTLQIYSPVITMRVLVDQQASTAGLAQNNTFSPSDTFTRNVTATGGPVQFITSSSCSEAGIASLISSVGSGGSAHTEGCTTAFKWSALLKITSPVSLWLPCTTMTVTNTTLGDLNATMLVVESNDVHIHTCGNGAAGNPTGSHGTATQIIAGGSFPSSGNMIVVGQPLANRTSLGAARTAGFTLDPIFINMNNSGNRAIYLSSCWHCKIDHPVIVNGNCGGGPDGMVTQEGALSGDTNGTESYFLDLEFPSVTNITTGNSNCHAYFFDARNGEVSQSVYDSLQANGVLGTPAGSGGDSLLVQTGSNLNDSFDKGLFLFPYLDNPSSGVYGIRIEAVGNHQAGTGGRFDQNTFIMPHLERLSPQSASGTAVGCTQSGTANGTGCGNTTIITPVIGNWTAGIDYGNLGENFALINEGNNPNGQSQFRSPGVQILPQRGDFFAFRVDPPKVTATGTNEHFHGFVADYRSTRFGGSSNPTNIHGFSFFSAGATGSSTNAYGFRCVGGDPTFGTGTNYCVEAETGTFHGGKLILGSGGTITNSGAGGTMAAVIASGTATMTTSSIAAISGTTITCGATVTVSASGVATTDTITVAPNAAESSPNTGLILRYWPTANNVNFAWCNPTASALTAGAETINWRVIR